MNSQAVNQSQLSSSQRFAHLLKPIRDLAESWNVDIASELEEYVEELDSFSFSLEGRRLNFSQAALVIQNSASIYSRKVESLYGLVNEAIHYILQKRQRGQNQDGNADVNASLLREEEEMMREFGPLIDILPQCDPSDLDLEEEDFAEPLPANNNTNGPRTPASAKSSRKSNVFSSVPLSYISALRTTSDESLERFRLATWTMHSSGALVLNADPRKLADKFPTALLNNNTSSSNARKAIATPGKAVRIVTPSKQAQQEKERELQKQQEAQQQQQQQPEQPPQPQPEGQQPQDMEWGGWDNNSDGGGDNADDDYDDDVAGVGLVEGQGTGSNALDVQSEEAAAEALLDEDEDNERSNGINNNSNGNDAAVAADYEEAQMLADKQIDDLLRGENEAATRSSARRRRSSVGGAKANADNENDPWKPLDAYDMPTTGRAPYVRKRTFAVRQRTAAQSMSAAALLPPGAPLPFETTANPWSIPVASAFSSAAPFSLRAPCVPQLAQIWAAALPIKKQRAKQNAAAAAKPRRNGKSIPGHVDQRVGLDATAAAQLAPPAVIDPHQIDIFARDDNDQEWGGFDNYDDNIDMDDEDEFDPARADGQMQQPQLSLGGRDIAWDDSIRIPNPHASVLGMSEQSTSLEGYGSVPDDDQTPMASFAQGREGETYEDAVRQHLAARARAERSMVAAADMQKRVADWQSRLEPKLVAEEKRVSFDMEKYAGSIVRSLKDKGKEATGEEKKRLELLKKQQKRAEQGMDVDEDEAQDQADKTASESIGKILPFSQLCNKVDQWEVCRLFLSVLQLTNHGNVTLQLDALNGLSVSSESDKTESAPKRGRGASKAAAAAAAASKAAAVPAPSDSLSSDPTASVGGKVIDDFGVQLLSTKLRSEEILEYNAPSLESQKKAAVK